MSFLPKAGMSLAILGTSIAAQAQDMPTQQDHHVAGINYVYNVPPAAPEKNIVFMQGRTDIALRGPAAELRMTGNDTVYVDGTNPAFMKEMISEITQSANLAKNGHAKNSRYELVGAEINEMNALLKEMKRENKLATGAGITFTVGAFEQSTLTNAEAVAAKGQLRTPLTLINN